MVSAIHAASMAYYTAMAHNSAYAMMSNNMARMGLLRNCQNLSFQGLAEAEKNLELQNLQNSLQYRIANAMLESLKAQEKQEKHINTYA